MKFNELTKEEKFVIEQKGTQRPFVGKYNDFYEDGIYLCKKCNSPLYKSEDKFSSGCGWPSFDDEIKDSVKRQLDSDGKRVEIVCSTCDAHLGHIFENEGFTPKNTRHCVNSISLKFQEKNDSEKIYFAAGCFWGVEYHFQKISGVLEVSSGYMGGDTINPSYEDVCTGSTGHLEVVRVKFDKTKVSLEKLIKLFFEIHDFSQTNGQGPDIGTQYLSAIFYTTNEQKIASEKTVALLSNMGYKVATSIYKAPTFYKAEDYHQNYYTKHQKEPYCHSYKKVFIDK